MDVRLNQIKKKKKTEEKIDKTKKGKPAVLASIVWVCLAERSAGHQGKERNTCLVREFCPRCLALDALVVEYYWGERRVLSPSRWPAAYRKIIFDTTDSSESTTRSTKDNN